MTKNSVFLLAFALAVFMPSEILADDSDPNSGSLIDVEVVATPPSSWMVQAQVFKHLTATFGDEVAEKYRDAIFARARAEKSKMK